MLFRSDRKSTRLNSSHTIISYAVFCLKKNKTDVLTVPADPPLMFADSARAPAVFAGGHLRACGPRHRGRRRRGSRPLRWFFFNDGPPPKVYPLPLPAALPI